MYFLCIIAEPSWLFMWKTGTIDPYVRHKKVIYTVKNVP